MNEKCDKEAEIFKKILDQAATMCGRTATTEVKTECIKTEQPFKNGFINSFSHGDLNFDRLILDILNQQVRKEYDSLPERFKQMVPRTSSFLLLFKAQLDQSEVNSKQSGLPSVKNLQLRKV